MKRNTILYTIYILLLTCLFTGCSDTEIPGIEDDLVAIELVGLNGTVQVTRAGIDPSLTEITNATIIVFDGTEDRILQRRTFNYANDERVYLKRGGTYRVFAIANLSDDNCPNGDATTYFDDVTIIDDLDTKYFISTTVPGKAPSKMPMISGSDISSLQSISLPVKLDDPTDNTTVTIPLRSLYTKVAVNIYNRISDGGSGVTPVSYYVNNLPAYSWIVEHTSSDFSDYARMNKLGVDGFERSSLMDMPSNPIVGVENGNTYNQYSFDLYCLENHGGTVAGLNSTNVYQRKAQAPDYAFEINFQSYVNGSNKDVLQTYVVIGKGYDDNDDPVYNDFNVDRNCIYRVNVFVNGIGNVEADSRRMRLNVVVCGGLEAPENGGIKEF